MDLQLLSKTSMQLFSTLLLSERETVRPSIRTSIYPSDDESEAEQSSQRGLLSFTFSSLFFLLCSAFMFTAPLGGQIVNKIVRILQSAVIKLFFFHTSDLSSSVSVMPLRVLHYVLF